jgi:broad specificity phosphatase PhoE
MDHLNLARSGVSEPTKVIFVRHGNVHNPRNLIYGRLPRMRLSERGREDVDRTGRHLADRSVSMIYSSPLLRARQSAAILAAYCRAPVRTTAWLAEVRTSWEGEDNKVVSAIRGFSYYDPLKAEGDETIHDVFHRMNRALRLVLRRHPGQTSVCVSHGDPIKILRVGYSGKPLTPNHVRAPDPGQASLVTFDFWDPNALPVISAIDLGRAEQLIHGKGLAEEPA